MIWAFVKAYWKQLLIMAMLAALVVIGVVAWNVHGDLQYAAGYEQAKTDRKAQDDKARQHDEQEKATNEREAQQRIDQARNDALDAAARAGRLSKSLERNRQLAEYADRAAEAGRVCEKQYDSLTR